MFDISGLVKLYFLVYLTWDFFLSCYTGFRCTRALYIRKLPDILQGIVTMKNKKIIRIIRLLSKFISIWFAIAGLIHLLENTGDFFCDYCNGQDIDIFNTVYFMIITMTTVEHCWKILFWNIKFPFLCLGRLWRFFLQNIHWKDVRFDLPDHRNGTQFKFYDLVH